jgi:copper(I)-binding protein
VSSIPNALRTCTVLGLAAALTTGLSACGSSSSGGAATTSAATTAASEPIAITQAWVRTTEGAMDTTMAPLFVTIKNNTANELSIKSGNSAVASRVEFHEMVMKDGKMVMQPKASGIKIPAGGTTMLKPGGDHVMLVGLKQALAVGSEVTVELTFSDGTTKTVTAPVKKYADGNAQYATGGATSSMSMNPSMSGSMSGSMSPSPSPSASMSGTMTP